MNRYVNMVAVSENKKSTEAQQLGRIPRTFPEFKLLLKGTLLCLVLFILHSGSVTKLATSPALTASDSCYHSVPMAASRLD